MAPFGDAVGLVARSEVRSRWRALLGLALLVALVGTASLSALAGARRTASSLDRFVDTTRARDARIGLPAGYDADGLDAALEDQPWVTASALMTRLVFATGPGTALTVGASDDPGFGSTVDRPLVVEGRLPRPGTTNEIAIDEQTVHDEGIGPGETLEVQTFEPENFACAIEQSCVLELPQGEPETLLVTGVFRDVDGLLSREFSPEAIAPPSFHEEYGDRTGDFGDEVLVRLAGGADDIDRLEALAEEHGDGALVLDAESDYLAFPRDAVDVLGNGLLVFATISALAGGLVLAQAVSRHLAAGRDRSLRLRELGLTRREGALAEGLPVAGAAVVGAVVTTAVAAPTSWWFPFGGAERIEPDPGFRFDAVGLGLGALGLVALTSAWAGWRAWHQADPRRLRKAPRPSGVAQALARLGADPALIGGARLAFERRADRDSSMMRSALVATTIGVLGAVAVGTVVVSLDDLVATPGQWGWNWDSIATPLDSTRVDRTATAIAGEDGVDGVAVYRVGLLDVDGEEVTAHALDTVTDVEHTLIDGREPDAADEIALGLLTRRDLDVEVGDTVTVTGPEGDTEDLDVVGTVVLPTFQDRDPGVGAVVTADAFDTLSSSGGVTELVVRYDDGVDTGDLEGRLSQDHGVGFRGSTLPVRLDNLDQARSIGPALVAFFAVLGFLGLVHALVTAVREREAMLAMLRLLGSRRAHVRRAVLWQAVFVTSASLLVGLPTGVAIGRWAWSRIIADLGVVAPPRVDLAHVALVIPVALVLALLGAIAPAWLAARRRIARALVPA